MKIYLLESDDVARELLQLLKLNAECAKLHWSRTIKNIPSSVVEALDTVESYVEEKVYSACGEKNLVGAMSEEEESDLMSLLRKMPELRSTLGAGVVMAGKEAEFVSAAIAGKGISEVLLNAITSGRNVILF